MAVAVVGLVLYIHGVNGARAVLHAGWVERRGSAIMCSRQGLLLKLAALRLRTTAAVTDLEDIAGALVWLHIVLNPELSTEQNFYQF